MGDSSVGECCEACCIVGAIYWIANNWECEGAEARNVSHGDISPPAVTEVMEPEDPGFLLRQIRKYQTDIGPRMKERLGKQDICRFEPTCSEYARQSIEKYGSFRGSLMTIGRLLRCNPFSKGGYDPVR